jgi:hypothetical protein
MPRKRKNSEKDTPNGEQTAGGYQVTTGEPTSLLTTSQAARMAGVSPSTIVRRRAELGAIPGPRGEYLIQAEVLQRNITTLRRRVAVTALGPASGEVASAVFAALKEGRHPSDIVIDQRVSPEVVMALREQFEQMHGRKPGAPKRLCTCGSGRSPCYCFDCAVTLDLGRIERRFSDGTPEVRITGQITWGRLPEKRPGRWSTLVVATLSSQWIRADSDDGRDLVGAVHRTRSESSPGEEQDGEAPEP